MLNDCEVFNYKSTLFFFMSLIYKELFLFFLEFQKVISQILACYRVFRKTSKILGQEYLFNIIEISIALGLER